jgi:hypothetical protein
MSKKRITYVISIFLILVFTIFSVNYCLTNKFGSITDLKAGKYSKSYQCESTDSVSLNILWKAGNIEIKTAEVPNVQITETAAYQLNNDEKLNITQDGKLISVSWNSKTNSLYTTDEKKNLMIEIPNTVSVSSCSIASQKGNIDLNNLNTAKLSASVNDGLINAESLMVSNSCTFYSDYGDILIKNSSIKSAAIKSLSGNLTESDVLVINNSMKTNKGSIKSSGEFVNYSADSINGDIVLNITTITKSIAVNSISGNISAAIPSDSNFGMDYQTLFGIFLSDFQSKNMGKSGTFIVGNNENTIKMHTTSGSVELRSGSSAVSINNPFEEG